MRYDGRERSAEGIERRRATHRARTRAQTAMAREHSAENLQLLTEWAVRPWSRVAYKRLQRQVYRELARRHPDTYRLFELELAQEIAP